MRKLRYAGPTGQDRLVRMPFLGKSISTDCSGIIPRRNVFGLIWSVICKCTDHPDGRLPLTQNRCRGRWTGNLVEIKEVIVYNHLCSLIFNVQWKPLESLPVGKRPRLHSVPRKSLFRYVVDSRVQRRASRRRDHGRWQPTEPRPWKMMSRNRLLHLPNVKSADFRR